MVFQEPKAEFVPIDLKTVISTADSFCHDWASQDPTGGGQRCIGTQPDADNCLDWDEMIPWSEMEGE